MRAPTRVRRHAVFISFRARSTARAALLTALPSSLLFLAACGGGGGNSDKVDVDDWVSDVCDLAKDAGDRQDDIFADLAEIDFAEDGARDDLVDALEKVLDEQEVLLKDFNDDIGEPDIEKGKNVRAAFKSDLDDNISQLKQAIKEIKKLDEGDDFEDDVNAVFDDIDDEDLREALEDLDENEVDDLIDLVDEDTDCSALVFSS